MSEELFALWFVGGLFVFLALCLGIGVLGGWIGQQIEERQQRPRLEAQAAAKRADAERKLEEARIRRLELELGLTTDASVDPAGEITQELP